MSQNLRSAILLALATTCVTPASGSVACKKGLAPAEDFACNANITFAICKLKAQIAELSGSYDEVSKCIAQWKKDIKPVYEAAKKKTATNPDASKALKDLYAYWLASMDALIPSPGETKGHYEAKLQERDQGIADRATKLTTEAE